MILTASVLGRTSHLRAQPGGECIVALWAPCKIPTLLQSFSQAHWFEMALSSELLCPTPGKSDSAGLRRAGAISSLFSVEFFCDHKSYEHLYVNCYYSADVDLNLKSLQTVASFPSGSFPIAPPLTRVK